MKITVIPGATYAITPSEECTVTTPDGIVIATCPAGGQTFFVAPSAEVEVSDGAALVTESFNGAPVGSSAAGGGNVFQTITVTGAATFSGGIVATEGTTTLGNVITANISVQRVDVAGPASFAYGVTIAQSLSVAGQVILQGGLNVGGDLGIYGSEGLPGGWLTGWWNDPYTQTIIVKSGTGQEFMGISYNSNTSQASLNLRGNAEYLSIPEKLVGPVQFYDPDRNYMLFGITHDRATGYGVGTDFLFRASGGLEVAGSAVFYSGVTMNQSLTVEGMASIDWLNGGCTISGSAGTTIITSNGGAMIFQPSVGNIYMDVVGSGEFDKAVIRKSDSPNILSGAEVVDKKEMYAVGQLDGRYVKFRRDLTDQGYADLAEKDDSTLYITTDTRKVYLGAVSLN